MLTTLPAVPGAVPASAQGVAGLTPKQRRSAEARLAWPCLLDAHADRNVSQARLHHSERHRAFRMLAAVSEKAG